MDEQRARDVEIILLLLANSTSPYSREVLAPFVLHWDQDEESEQYEMEMERQYVW